MEDAVDLRQLRYFLAIVEAGSITAAANDLGVAQPALSLHVKTMEETLGSKLLFRSKTGVTPTEAGLLLMQRARTILDDLSRTVDDIRTLGTDPMSNARIGLPGTISNIVTLPLIKALHTRFPRIQLNVAEAMSGFISDWIDEGRVDLAVLYEPSNSPRISSKLLLEEELVVLWPHDPDRPTKTSLADLRDVPMVLPSGAHGLRGLVDRACGALGFAPNVALEIDSYANIKRLVEAGYGASILPTHAVRAESRPGNLSISHIAPPGIWRGAWLTRPEGRPATRAKEAVLSVTEEVIATLLTDGTWAGARRPR